MKKALLVICSIMLMIGFSNHCFAYSANATNNNILHPYQRAVKPPNNKIIYSHQLVSKVSQVSRTLKTAADQNGNKHANPALADNQSVTSWGLSRIDLPQQTTQSVNQQHDNLVMNKEISSKNKKITYTGQPLAITDYTIPFQNKTLTRFSIRLNQPGILWKLTLTDMSGKVIGEQEGSYQQLDIPLLGNTYNSMRVTVSIEQSTNNPVRLTSIVAVNRVSVAVIDSGVSHHVDFGDNILYSIGRNYSGGDSKDISDHYGHGTHVVGILAATGSDHNDVRGVLGQAPVDIIPIKALNDLGLADDASISQAIDYATHLGVSVINLSIAGQGKSTQLEAAIRRAIQAGIVVVAASGNNHTAIDHIYPAAYPGVLTVTGSDQNNHPLSVADYGWKIDLTAPGSQILSTYLHNSYRALSGTSMAVPYVSGAAALLKAAQPQLTVLQVRRRLIDSAKDIGVPGLDPKTGAGLLQVAKALQLTEHPMVDWLTLKQGQPITLGKIQVLAVDPSLVGDSADITCNGQSFVQKQLESQWQTVSLKCPDDGYYHETVSVTIKNQTGKIAATNKRVVVNASIKDPFKDVSTGFWAIDSILSAYHTHIVKGYLDHTFRPNQALTRRHALMILAEAKDFPTLLTIKKLPYKDVPKNLPGSTAIYYATKIGLVHGYPNHDFHPEASLTRGEAAVLLNKLIKLPSAIKTQDKRINPFKDVPAHYFAYKSIQHLVSLGIIKNQLMFHPDASITRAEFLVMLNHAQSFFK